MKRRASHHRVKSKANTEHVGYFDSTPINTTIGLQGHDDESIPSGYNAINKIESPARSTKIIPVDYPWSTTSDPGAMRDVCTTSLTSKLEHSGQIYGRNRFTNLSRRARSAWPRKSRINYNTHCRGRTDGRTVES